MRFSSALFNPASSSLLPVLVTGVAAGIFLLDLITDLELATAVLYVAVVMLSSRFCRPRGILLVAAGCMTLTILGYFFTFGEGSPRTGIINGAISLLTIAITAYLTLKIAAAQETVLEARAQLAHVARVMALGELAASIAHEVNQPLGAVVTSGNACLRWLAAEPANLEKAKQAVERIVKDANRASAVIVRVRNFANRTPPQYESFNINEIILEVISLTQSELQQHDIGLKAILGDDLPAVCGDRIQLQQVLLNLIINSIDAIETAAPASREVVVASSKDDTDGVRVVVQDSGAGLDPNTIGQLFEPYYTTKKASMGIGLTISRSIIEAHGGRISATPLKPRGALFQFNVPARKERGNDA